MMPYKELVEIFHVIIEDGLDRLSQSIESDLKDPTVDSRMDIEPNHAMYTRRLPRRRKVLQTREKAPATPKVFFRRDGRGDDRE